MPTKAEFEAAHDDIKNKIAEVKNEEEFGESINELIGDFGDMTAEEMQRYFNGLEEARKRKRPDKPMPDV